MSKSTSSALSDLSMRDGASALDQSDTTRRKENRTVSSSSRQMRNENEASKRWDDIREGRSRRTDRPLARADVDRRNSAAGQRHDTTVGSALGYSVMAGKIALLSPPFTIFLEDAGLLVLLAGPGRPGRCGLKIGERWSPERSLSRCTTGIIPRDRSRQIPCSLLPEDESYGIALWLSWRRTAIFGYLCLDRVYLVQYVEQSLRDPASLGKLSPPARRHCTLCTDRTIQFSLFSQRFSDFLIRSAPSAPAGGHSTLTSPTVLIMCCLLLQASPTSATLLNICCCFGHTYPMGPYICGCYVQVSSTLATLLKMCRYLPQI